jgi:formamidopyrimidine-DNA glycosylase
MPELPDLQVYIDALADRVAGRKLLRVRVLNPFLLRTAVPPISAAEGKEVRGIRRIGKRLGSRKRGQDPFPQSAGGFRKGS